MTAKQYLKKAKRIDAFIKAKNEELEELRAKSTSVGAVQLTPDKVQTSHSSSDKLANDIINILECEERIKKAIQDYILLKDEINDKIEEIENDDFRLILQLRYLNQKDWETIAIEMNFSYSHTLSLHKQALDAFEEKHHDFLCS